jgi:hypothetical protein
MLSKMLISRVWLLFLVQAGVACSNASNSDGSTTFRNNAEFAYVMYVDGSCAAATRVHVDLDTGGVSVGVGRADALSVLKSTMTAEEVGLGRWLFEQDQITAYQQASVPAGAATQTPTGGSAPAEDVDESGDGDGIGPSDTPARPPSTCSGDEPSLTGVTIYAPPGFAKRTSLLFAKDAAAEPPVSEMLEYFSELAARYHP